MEGGYVDHDQTWKRDWNLDPIGVTNPEWADLHLRIIA